MKGRGRRKAASTAINLCRWLRYQQGAHQHRQELQTRCLPGGHQGPQNPLQAASVTIGVMLWASAWKLAAPVFWVCAPALKAIEPSIMQLQQK